MNRPVPLTRVAQRVCLKCGKTFKSRGPGNRICKDCSRVNARLGPMLESVLARERGAKRQNGELLNVPYAYDSVFPD